MIRLTRGKPCQTLLLLPLWRQYTEAARRGLFGQHENTLGYRFPIWSSRAWRHIPNSSRPQYNTVTWDNASQRMRAWAWTDLPTISSVPLTRGGNPCYLRVQSHKIYPTTDLLVLHHVAVGVSSHMPGCRAARIPAKPYCVHRRVCLSVCEAS